MASTRSTRKPSPTPAARPGPTKRTGDKGVAAVVSELWTLTVDYAKQEIKDPLTGLVSYVAWGVATMLLVGVGSILLAIGALRALQTETGSTFTGNWSWAPYGIVLAGSVVVLGAVGALIMRGRTNK
ncbi:MAG TPA: hypothetical protein VFU14_00455 [Acidimicrobiales bacterium]|nr:hypothetical protein [Acidimicrobiales bacterium]